jgi:hypothetical protein
MMLLITSSRHWVEYYANILRCRLYDRPLVAGFLFDRSETLVLLTATAFMVLGLGLYMLLKKSFGSHQPQQLMLKKHTILHEFKIWRVLLPSLWPIVLFVFMATVLDATFWTIGALFSESLKAEHPLGGFLLTVYVLPSLFAGFVGANLSEYLGKKRTAFIAGMCAGLCLWLLVKL